MTNKEMLAVMEQLEGMKSIIGGFLASTMEAGLSRSAAEALLLKQMGVDVVFHAEGGQE